MSKTSELKAETNILVLGIGNILLSDEGAGIKVIEQLQQQYKIPDAIEVTDGGTMGVELLPWIEKRSHIIIVDAIRSDNPPGSVLKVDDVPAFFQNKISPHQIGITDVLAMAYILDDLPPSVILIGVEPETLSGGIELSETISGKIDTMVDMVVSEIENYGVSMQRLVDEQVEG